MEKVTSHKLVCSTRFLLSIVGFFLNMIHFMQRVNLSVAIICMVKNDNNMTSEDNTELENFNFNKSEIDSLNDNFSYFVFQKNSFDWPKKLQGIILGSIFLGSLISQIAAGWISLIVGPKLVILISVFKASLLTTLTPFAANHSYQLLILCRFLIGIAQGCVTASLNVLWASWAPPYERSTLIAISSSGCLIGNAIAFAFGGLMCLSDFFSGWPLIFFSTGLSGLLWCVLWIFVGASRPDNHKFITHQEKAYIVRATFEDAYLKNQKNKIPWKKMLTSKVVIGLIVTNYCANFTISLFITCLPIYMNDILNYDIASNGELSALPFLTCWIVIVFSGVFSDYLIRTNKCSKLFARKLFNSVGAFTTILTFSGLMFVTSNTRLIAFILILTNITCGGFQFGSGYLVSFNDIGGSLSGVIYGFANTIAGIGGILAPFLMGILTSNKNQTGWIYIFVISTVVSLIGSITYLIFASAETLEWAKNKQNDNQQSDDQTTTPLNE